MKKRFIMAMLALLAQVPQASANGVYFVGEAYILSSSSQCDYNMTGTRYAARYQPANLGSNGSVPSFAWFPPNGASSTLGFVSNGGAFGPTPQTVSIYAIYAGGVGGSPYTTSVTFTTQSPATLLETTKFVFIRGTITNFSSNSIAGCTLTFQMPLSPN